MANPLPPFRSFAGELLVSAQNETGRFFDKTLILITKHTESGAEGFVLNHPLQTLTPKEVFKHRDISFLGADFHIYRGGPVELGRGSVLHTDDYHALDTMPLPNGLAFTQTQQILDDISLRAGPEHFLALVGKCAWEKGQLEDELMGNVWIPVPFSRTLIFATEDNKKWQNALATLNIDINLLANDAGRA